MSRRLFFALWPDEAARVALAKLSRKAVRGHGKLVADANLHLTLYFLGAVDDEQQACAERVADAIEGSCFTFELARIGHWPKPKVVWSAPAETPNALITLVEALRAGLSGCGFTPDSRPYRAHLTLARKVGRPIPETSHKAIRWQVDQLALVQSITHPTGVEYRPLKFWGLRGAG